MLHYSTGGSSHPIKNKKKVNNYSKKILEQTNEKESNMNVNNACS